MLFDLFWIKFQHMYIYMYRPQTNRIFGKNWCSIQRTFKFFLCSFLYWRVNFPKKRILTCFFLLSFTFFSTPNQFQFSVFRNFQYNRTFHRVDLLPLACRIGYAHPTSGGIRSKILVFMSTTGFFSKESYVY